MSVDATSKPGCAGQADPGTGRTEGEKRAIVIADMGGGGSQRVVRHLAGDWLDAGHAVTVITLSATDTDQVRLPPTVRRIALNAAGASSGLSSGLLSNLRRVRAIRRAIRESGAIRVVSFLAATNILAILACRGLPVRLVISERNDPSRQRIGRVWELLRRRLYPRADCVTANSREALKSLAAFVPASKLRHVPNPLPEWPGEPPPSSARERLVLAVGRLHRQKAYDLMLPIFAASKARALGWRLAILGEGGERAALEALAAELRIADIVDMPGHAESVRDWYDRAGALMMTSRYEGTPNAVLEALSRGLPALVSGTCGDVSDIVRRADCGCVVDPERVAASAEALDRLLQDGGLRDRQSLNGRRALAEEFSAEQVRQAWEAAVSAGRPDGQAPGTRAPAARPAADR